MDKRITARFLLMLILAFLNVDCFAGLDPSIQNLKVAYPKYVQSVSRYYIDWHDGTRMQLGGSPSLFSWIGSSSSKSTPKIEIINDKDVLHARFTPFFKKMYGSSPREVGRNLVTVYWMPHVFGKRYPLRVTSINGVDKKLRRISANLEKLPSKFYKYLDNPGGSYYWRKIEGESSLSSHSFGIAIDINLHYSNYWLWDYQKTNKPIEELRYHKLSYQNRIPMEIVQIFEKEGFFWGGRWYFYDTMHFEYRPDLLLQG